MKSLSIIIPTYNRRDFLERCLYCLYETANIDKNIESIFIWDDGSTDDTPDFLASLKKWSIFSPMRSKINIGTESVNKVLPLIKTEYVMTLEDDMWISTRGWDDAAIDVLNGESLLGSVSLSFVMDERCWFGVKNKTFSKPRFRCENLINWIPKLPVRFIGEDKKEFYRKNELAELNYSCLDDYDEHDYKKEISSHKVMFARVKDDGKTNFDQCSGSSVWRTSPLSGYKWKSHAGKFSDVFGEWGVCVEDKGYSRGILMDYIAYHAVVSPWWHLGREKDYWINKCMLATKSYNRSYDEQWSWYKQAEEWSEWGTGLQDLDEALITL